MTLLNSRSHVRGQNSIRWRAASHRQRTDQQTPDADLPQPCSPKQVIDRLSTYPVGVAQRQESNVKTTQVQDMIISAPANFSLDRIPTLIDGEVLPGPSSVEFVPSRKGVDKSVVGQNSRSIQHELDHDPPP